MRLRLFVYSVHSEIPPVLDHFISKYKASDSLDLEGCTSVLDVVTSGFPFS